MVSSLRGLRFAALIILGIGLASASSLCLSPPPSAGSVCYEQALFTSGGFEHVVQTTPVPWGPVSVFLPRFDTQGGLYTLTGVSLNFNWTTTGNPYVQNGDPASSHTFSNLQITVPLTIAGPAVPNHAFVTNANTVPINSATATATSVKVHGFPSRPGVLGEPVPAGVWDDLDCTDPGNSDCEVSNSKSIYNGQHGAGSSNYVPADVSSYFGDGLANLTFTITDGNVGVSGFKDSSLVAFGGSASVGGTLQVIYTFSTNPPLQSSVPEPVTMLLVGSAMLGIGIAFRKRNKV